MRKLEEGVILSSQKEKKRLSAWQELSHWETADLSQWETTILRTLNSSNVYCSPPNFLPHPTPFFFGVQPLSLVQLFSIPWTAAHQASLSFTISRNLFKSRSIESMMLSNHLILCHPLLLLSIFPSIRVFSNELTLHFRWPKYWSFSFSMRPSNEYSGLISFRIDWFDFLTIQGTLKSLFQILSLFGVLHMACHGYKPWIAFVCWYQISPLLLEK